MVGLIHFSSINLEHLVVKYCGYAISQYYPEFLWRKGRTRSLSEFLLSFHTFKKEKKVHLYLTKLVKRRYIFLILKNTCMHGRVLSLFLGGSEVLQYHRMQWKVLNRCPYLHRNHYKLDYFSVATLYIQAPHNFINDEYQ